KATAVEGYDEYLAGIGPFVDVSAASAAAEAAYAAAQKTAWITLIGKDGDAEINQSQTDGGAEQTLAQALGLDEKSLTGELVPIDDGLAGEQATADEQLALTDAGDGADETILQAQDNEQWTDDTGIDNENLQTQLGVEEVVAATNIAGAEANYAVAVAQQNAAAADAFYQQLLADVAQPPPAGAPDAATVHAAAFQAAYADEYVNWLETLTPAFIANSAAIAQEDADNQYAATLAEVNLQDTIAADDVQFATTDAPQEAQNQEEQTDAGDDYQTSLIEHEGEDEISL